MGREHERKSTAPRPSRRDALKCGAAGIFPLLLPSGVLAQPGRPGANDRILTGHIGTGLQGRVLLEACTGDAVAVCDVFRRNREMGAAIAGAGVKVYEDYRALLEQSDVDAVVIASPDHWHTLHALHAMEAGKDVYLEIPLSRHLGELPLLRRVAAQRRAVLATGALAAGSSTVLLRQALSEAGIPQTVTCWAPAEDLSHTTVYGEQPEGLDWDAWVGPAPWSPYIEGFENGAWKQHFDWGGGRLRRQGVNLMACVLAAMGIEGATRVEVLPVSAGEGASTDPVRQASRHIKWTLPDDDLKLVWKQPGPEGAAPCGLSLECESGSVSLEGCTVMRSASDGDSPPDAETNVEEAVAAWKHGIRAREESMLENSSVSLATMLAHLGNLSLRLNRPLNFDVEAMRFVDDDAADRWVLPPGRGAYTW
jgi:hypothetical protein